MRFSYDQWHALLIQSFAKTHPCTPDEYGMSINTQKKKKRGGAKKRGF